MTTFAINSVTSVSLGAFDTISVSGIANIKVTAGSAQPFYTSNQGTQLYGPYGAATTFVITALAAGSYTQTVGGVSQFPVIYDGTSLRADGVPISSGVGDALVANPLSQFAATTSAQLAGVLSDETGTGAAVFGTSPTLTTPTLSGAVAGTATLPATVTMVASPSQADNSLKIATTAYVDTLGATKAGAVPAALVLVDGDFTSNNINITKAAHLNRLIISDKTAAGTLTITNDATSGANATDDALVVYQRGAGVISITGGTGTVINAQGAAAPLVMAKGQFTELIHTVADTMTSDAALSPSKFDWAMSGPSLLSYRTGSTTPTNIGVAADNPLNSSTIVGTASTADGAQPFSFTPRGRFQGSASAINTVAGYSGGNVTGRMGDLTFWPIVVTFSIDDVSPSLGTLWAGLCQTAAPVFTTSAPSAETARKVGFGMDEGDANLKVWARGTAGNSTRTDLGANFARAQYNLYIAVFWGDATNVYCQVMNQQNGAISAVYPFTGTTAPSVADSMNIVAIRGSLSSVFQPLLGVSMHSSGKWQGKIGL